MAAQSSSVAACFRHPRRITITMPHHVASSLQRRSDEEGRSLSNLAAYLLECSLRQSAYPEDPGMAHRHR
jgi:hypothetical protein